MKHTFIFFLLLLLQGCISTPNPNQCNSSNGHKSLGINVALKDNIKLFPHSKECITGTGGSIVKSAYGIKNNQFNKKEGNTIISQVMIFKMAKEPTIDEAKAITKLFSQKPLKAMNELHRFLQSEMI